MKRVDFPEILDGNVARCFDRFSRTNTCLPCLPTDLRFKKSEEGKAGRMRWKNIYYKAYWHILHSTFWERVKTSETRFIKSAHLLLSENWNKIFTRPRISTTRTNILYEVDHENGFCLNDFWWICHILIWLYCSLTKVYEIFS